MNRLLEPGYGGDLSLSEVVYIKVHLKASPTLRRRWGFRTSRISDQAIRKVAREGVDHAQNPLRRHFKARIISRKKGGI